MSKQPTRTIKVDALARVEGEGALYIKLKGDQVQDVKLKIYEPPRFFEAFLRGRHFSEAPDIMARICGICPIAYQMSAVHAIEGLSVSGSSRPCACCGGSSIAANGLRATPSTSTCCTRPDFLGYPDAIAMAKDHPAIVSARLQLKKVGNQIVSLLGGREIHPINVRVGGFYKLPARGNLLELAERLKWARDAALETVRWVATLPFPDFERNYIFVALRHPPGIPLQRWPHRLQ